MTAICLVPSVLLLLAGLAAWALARSSAFDFAAALRWRTASILGALLVLVGFFLCPWVTFQPAAYLREVPPWLVDTIPFLDQSLLSWLPDSLAQGVLGLVQGLSSLTGAEALLVMPAPAIGVRLTMLYLVGLALGVLIQTIVWGLKAGSAVVRERLEAKLGAQFRAALLAALLLVLCLPAVDILGATWLAPVRVALVLLGVRISWGVWVVLAGLLLLAAAFFPEVDHPETVFQVVPSAAPSVARRGPRGERRLGYWILAAVALVLVLNFFLLPWTDFVVFGRLRPNIDLSLLQRLGSVAEYLRPGSDNPLRGDIGELFVDQRAPETFLDAWGLAQRVTGLMIAVGLGPDYPQSVLFRILAVLTLLLALALIVVLALTWLADDPRSLRRVGSGAAIAGALGAAWVVACLPTADTFGLRNDLVIALLAALLRSGVGIGVWVALGSMIALAVAGVVLLTQAE